MKQVQNKSNLANNSQITNTITIVTTFYYLNNFYYCNYENEINNFDVQSAASGRLDKQCLGTETP